MVSTNLSAFGVDESLRDVGFVHKYTINVDGENFEYTITANFNVLSHTFNTDDKMLQFDVQAIHEKENIAEIIIPRDMFDSELTVLLNSKEIFAQVNETERSLSSSSIVNSPSNKSRGMIISATFSFS